MHPEIHREMVRFFAVAFSARPRIFLSDLGRASMAEEKSRYSLPLLLRRVTCFSCGMLRCLKYNKSLWGQLLINNSRTNIQTERCQLFHRKS